MLHVPPISPPFPYTTLFRSHPLLEHAGGVLHVSDPSDERGDEEQDEHQTRERDRKSTRLNSSHANISYAAFCLKKRKKPRANRGRRYYASVARIAILAYKFS